MRLARSPKTALVGMVLASIAGQAVLHGATLIAGRAGSPGMPGRGSLTFKKRQREQHQKEKQAEKLVRRLEHKQKASDAEEQTLDLSSLSYPQQDLVHVGDSDHT
jgi:hypothetical protein